MEYWQQPSCKHHDEGLCFLEQYLREFHVNDSMVHILLAHNIKKMATLLLRDVDVRLAHLAGSQCGFVCLCMKDLDIINLSLWAGCRIERITLRSGVNGVRILECGLLNILNFVRNSRNFIIS